MNERKFAVFDFDGTLIRWQLYHAIVDELVKEKLVDKKSYQSVKDARHRWKIRASENAFREYEMELVNCYQQALPNILPKQLDKAVEKVFDEHKEQVYVYTRELVKELKNKGYFLVAISGSHREAVELVAKHYGFNDWVGTKFEVVNGKFTGKYQLASREKEIILRKLIEEYNLTLENSVGVGDSESDIPMLEMVENPIAFNPNKKLLNYAQDKGWKIVAERKNVVYELNSIDKNGKYNYYLS